MPNSKTKLFLLLAVSLSAVALLFLFINGDGRIYEMFLKMNSTLEKGPMLREKLLSFGPLAPVLFMGIQTLQVIFAPIPGEASGILGGYLFGPGAGFVYSTIGLTFGSWIAFSIGRLLDDIVRTRLHQTKTYQHFNHLLTRGDFVIPFILFLLPGFPKDSLSYLLGLTTMPLPVFLFMTGIGRMPGTLMLSVQGADIYHGNYPRLIALLIASAAIVLLCYYYRKKILAFLHLYNNKNSKPEAPRQEDDNP